MRKLELIVGCFILVGIAAIAYFAVSIAGGRLLGGKTYTIAARFNSTSGLTVGSNVVIAGVSIGKVEGIHLDPERFDALVTMRINDNNICLGSESTASIKTSGLIGNKYIMIQPGADDDIIPQDGSGCITETHSPLDVEDLISRFAFGSLGKTDKNEESEEK